MAGGVQAFWALAVAPLALAGCFSELLVPPPTTVLAFSCLVLDPPPGSLLVLESWGEGVGSAEGVAALRAELLDFAPWDASAVLLRSHGAARPPGGSWQAGEVAAWGQERPFGDDGTLVFRILWLESLGQNATGGSGPGVAAVALDAVQTLSVLSGRPPGEVAAILLLHHAGHALGAINRGIPVQDPTLQDREGGPGHEPDPASVLHGGWEDVRTASWAPGATYERYSDAVRGDWAAAAAPGGVCA